MGLLRLGFITIFLSDPLISGFTTGAACWVFTSQIKHILAIYPERHSGPFAIIKVRVNDFNTIKSKIFFEDLKYYCKIYIHNLLKRYILGGYTCLKLKLYNNRKFLYRLTCDVTHDG